MLSQFRCSPNARVVFPNGPTRISDEDYFAALLDRHHLEVRHIDPQVGRGLFAKRSFKAGEVILTEPPVASVLSSGSKHCANCLSSLEVPGIEVNGKRLSQKQAAEILKEYPILDPESHLIRRCEDCKQIFCSDECRTSALARFHLTECGTVIPPLPASSGPAFPIWQLLWRCLLALAGPQAATIHDHLERFSYTEDDSQEPGADLALMIAAASTLPSLPQLYRNERKLRNMASALMQNAFALTIFPPKVLIITRGSDQISFDMAIDRELLAPTGAGVYPLLRYINHVCPGSVQENVAVAYPATAHAKVLLAAKDIGLGEEICWPYRMNPNHEERRKELQETYGFSCNCDVCTAYLNSKAAGHSVLSR